MKTLKDRFLERGLCSLVILTALPFCGTTQAPWEGNAPLWEQRVEAKAISLDKLGQTYVITPENILLRFNAQGQPSGNFAQPALGRLAAADVSDPLSVLLWYPDFQTLLLLDRTLVLLGTIRLPDDIFPFPALTARGRDNRIWIFDTFRNRLIGATQQGQPVAQSQDLSLGGISPQEPHLLSADDQGFFLSDTLQGLWRFDRLGQLQYFLPIPHVDLLQPFSSNQFLIRKEGRYYLLSGQSPPAPLELPFPCTFLSLQPQRAVVWHNGVLRYFQK